MIPIYQYIVFFWRWVETTNHFVSISWIFLEGTVPVTPKVQLTMAEVWGCLVMWFTPGNDYCNSLPWTVAHLWTLSYLKWCFPMNIKHFAINRQIPELRRPFASRYIKFSRWSLVSQKASGFHESSSPVTCRFSNTKMSAVINGWRGWFARLAHHWGFEASYPHVIPQLMCIIG